MSAMDDPTGIEHDRPKADGDAAPPPGEDREKEKAEPPGGRPVDPTPPAGGHKRRGALVIRMGIMLACVALLFGGIFGFKTFNAHMIQKAMSSRQQPPVTVSTAKAAYQPWQSRIQAVGTARAERGVNVTTEIAGLVLSMHFESGDRVRKDQVLVQLNADADVALLHSLQAEAELARTTFERDRQQFAIKAISQATLDVAAADLKSRDARVAQQEALVRKKTIRAPFAGRLGITFVNPGQYLHPGDSIVTLQAIHRILVDFLVPQKEIPHFSVGQTVGMTADAYPGRTFEGKVTVINPEVDSPTRNVRIEAAVDNPKGELLPGMFVSMDIRFGEPERRLTLPATAVTYNPYGETVFVVESKGKGPDGRPLRVAKQRFVTVGETRGDQVAILKGIQEGDRVVTAGQLKLKSGSPVVINNKIQPSNDKAPKPPDR